MKDLFLKAIVLVSSAIMLGLLITSNHQDRPDLIAFGSNNTSIDNTKGEENLMSDKVIKDEDEWRKQLTPKQYEVTRLGGTEAPFAGKYYKFHGKGIYRCVCCGNELFSSDTKYDSGSGWPSFWAPLPGGHVITKGDHSHGMVRSEVLCSKCAAHLGHVFDDGPDPTGLRYCINSAALEFDEGEEGNK